MIRRLRACAVHASMIRLAAVVALVCAAAHPTVAAITVNGASTSAATVTSAMTLNWQHEVFAGDDRVLVVGISLELGQSMTVAYGGLPLTLIGRYTGSSSHTIELWRRINPPIGDATILATFDASREAIGGATTFNGVDPVTPAAGFLGASTDSDSPSVTITSAAGELVIDTLFVDVNNLSAAPDASQTQRWNLTNGRQGAGSTKPGAGSVVMDWTLTGADEWTLAGASLKPVVGSTISGTVFEDADFSGTATAYDGGPGDKALQGVDVELYDGATDAYITSKTTAADGSYSFSGLADGSYKVRVRSSTIGSGTATPKGGLNACVPATCPNPLAEMTWGNGAALYGGQSATVDDTATGDNLGPGDTYLPVTVSGANVSGVDFGFAYNLIVNTTDDANAANLRSVQGGLRQFVKNANAIGSAGSTTANSSEFRMQVPANQSAGGDTWWRITAAAAMTPFSDSGTTLDASTQAANAGSASNSRGPEIEWFGNAVAGSGLEINNVGNTTIRELTVNSFQSHGIYIHGASASGNKVYGSYLGTDAIGENALPNLDFGIWVNDNTSNTNIGSAGAGDGNVISGNGGSDTEGEIAISLQSTGVTILGNKIGTDRTGTQPLGGLGPGITMSGANGVTIGGVAAGAGNIISGNGSSGIRMTNFVENVSILGNSIGVGTTGSETTLGNGSDGIFITSFQDPSNIVVGGTAAGEGNVIAESAIYGVRNQTSGTGDSIQGNTIRNNDGGGIRSETDGLLIAKNLVANNSGVGVHLLNDGGTAANNNKVYQNTIHGSSSDGILVAGSGALIRNSIVTGSGGFGINVTTGGMMESDNLVTDASTAPANTSGRSNVALDAGDLNLDPRYDNAAGGDFTLNECLSPAVEWGADLGVDQPDMNGPLAGKFNGSAPDQGAFETICTQPAIADLGISKTDAPDPAPNGGPLVYTLIISNSGPGTATNVTVTDVLPVSTALNIATPSQGSCMGTTTVTCNLGAILNGGTASVEIQVVTSANGNITNNAGVAADQADLVPGNDTDAEITQVVNGGTTDIPLTQYDRIHGFVDFTVTGGTLRTQPNTGNPCLTGNSGSETLSGIPATATVIAAYLYWAGSGAAVDSTVTFDGVSVTADRTFVGQFVLGATDYDFFSGFEDVTTQVAAKGNGSYSFADVTVDTGDPWCKAKAVVSGWSLLVVYEDTLLTGKTLVLYDGFDIARNGASTYVLTGIWAADPPEAKAAYILWEGDPDLAGGDERLDLNATSLSDGLNPVDNVYNSTINSLGSAASYGLDLDTFDVSAQVNVGDTLATTEVSTGPDLVILNAVMLQVKSNIIVGSVFEDVNYGGGSGRNRAVAAAAAPTFAVSRPGAVVELYDAAGNFLRTTTTNVNGEYGFAGLIDGNYFVRSVNDSVTSSRPDATGSEWPVQTYRTDASTGAVVAVTGEVGGADPGAQDSPANVATANLSTLTAQSVTPVQINTGVAVPNVDFGYNFDTIVNTNDGGQGSLRQFILNSNNLTNANLDQDDAPAGVSAVTKNAGDEHSIFMIPAAELVATVDGGGGTVMLIQPSAGLDSITDANTALDGRTQTALTGDTNGAVAELTTGPEVIVDLQGTVAANVLTDRGNDTIVDSLGLTGALGLNNHGIDAGPLDGAHYRNNTIFDNGAVGVYLSAVTGTTVSNSVIRDNGVAEDVADGVVLTNGSMGNTISGNEIVANAGFGVDSTATGDNSANTITGNLIKGNGVSASDQNAGIKIDSADNSSITLNTITANAGDGIVITSGDSGNLISQNAIFNNGELAIDLSLNSNNGGDGVTPNDDPDLPGGGNNRQNFPLITFASWNGANTVVKGTLTSTPGATFDIEIFSSGVCNGAVNGSPQADAYGEGETYRATVNVTDGDSDGIVTFSANIPVNLTGQQITATATDTSNDTSEFSACYRAIALSIVKRAFQIDGTPIASGSALPAGMPVKFLLYIDNPGNAIADVSLQDVLAALFAYQAGSIKVDVSLDSATVCPGGVCNDATIFAKVDGTPNVCGTTGFECTDAQDSDPVSLSGTTLYAGDGVQTGNAQLDLPSAKIWAMSFTIVLQ